MLSLTATYYNGVLQFDKPVKFDNPVKVIVTFIDDNNNIQYILDVENTDKNKKFNFTEIAGKLEWKGDALTEQKLLRDEW